MRHPAPSPRTAHNAVGPANVRTTLPVASKMDHVIVARGGWVYYATLRAPQSIMGKTVPGNVTARIRDPVTEWTANVAVLMNGKESHVI